jgi:hypothetical protein
MTRGVEPVVAGIWEYHSDRIHRVIQGESAILCEYHSDKIHRVIQGESAILWEMIVCVILSKKKVRMSMGPIYDGYGVTGIFYFPYTPSCETRLQPRLTASASV